MNALLIQDVLLEHGGAERVYHALCGLRFAKTLVGLDATSGTPEIADQVLMRSSDAQMRDPGPALRALISAIHKFRKVPQRTLVAHHHAGLQFAVEPGVASLYMHTPTRFLWERERATWELEVFSDDELDVLRQRELSLVRAAHSIATNSAYTAKRITTVYGRAPVVIYPPVSLWRTPPRAPAIAPDLTREPYMLCVARLVEGKRIELLVEAARMADIAVVIVGAGRLTGGTLRTAGSERVAFLGRRPDHELRWLVMNAAMVAVATPEDFGISIAEALCEGTPVVIPDRGGGAEIFVDGAGAVFEADNLLSLVAAIQTVSAQHRLTESLVGRYREAFDADRFRRRITELMRT